MEVTAELGPRVGWERGGHFPLHYVLAPHPPWSHPTFSPLGFPLSVTKWKFSHLKYCVRFIKCTRYLLRVKSFRYVSRRKVCKRAWVWSKLMFSGNETQKTHKYVNDGPLFLQKSQNTPHLSPTRTFHTKISPLDPTFFQFFLQNTT